MYLRPGNLYKYFIIEENTSEVGRTGRPQTSYNREGRPQAKAEDKLILGNRVFLIQGLEEPGSIGVCTIYYVEERVDVQ